MVALSTVAKVGALALALLLGGAQALGTNYEHDSVTTYCWAIPRRTNETKLSEADRTTAFSTRAQCPMVLTLSLPPSDSIRAFDAVNVTWTVQVDFSGSNAINNTRLYFGPDKTGRPAQIVHSNVHSCVFGTGCDPFNDGKELVDKTVNKIANFSDNKATFADTLQFPTPGEYSVLAHIILPNFNESSRFDYAVYSKVTVLAAAAATAAPTAAPQQTSAAPVASESSSSSGLSQGATIAIIVGAIVVVVALAVIVVAMRRRRGDNRHTGGYMQAPVNEAGFVGGGVRPSGANAMKQSDLTDTNSTSGFQSAWGGGGGANRPSGLDNTNQSSASSGSQSNPQYSNHQYGNQYGAPPRPSDVRGGSDMSSQFTSSMHQPDMSASAYFSRPSGTSSVQNPRKKRVDSDVEL